MRFPLQFSRKQCRRSFEGFPTRRILHDMSNRRKRYVLVVGGGWNLSEGGFWLFCSHLLGVWLLDQGVEEGGGGLYAFSYAVGDG